MALIYVGGTFDLLHVGHIELLEQASQFGDVVVALNTDEFVERYKGKKPVMPYDERLTMLKATKYVDIVIKNIGCEDSSKTIEMFHKEMIEHKGEGYADRITAIAHGTDWTGDSLYKQMGLTQEWLDRNMISMLYIPRTTGQSSTNIKENA